VIYAVFKMGGALLLCLVIFIALYFVMLFLGQDKIIYYPQRYGERERSIGSTYYTLIEYQTSQGSHVAYYHDPGQGIPERIWVMFHGNASVALHWTEFVSDFPDKEAAFLLIDYPGYGQNDGKPSPESIEESADAALVALALHLKISAEDLTPRLSALGLSLGAAAALQFAAPRLLKRVVLITPFTSMQDMAARVVGKWASFVLRHNFDNQARLAELIEGNQDAKVAIVHGTEDEVIPFSMGKALSELYPKRTTFIEVRGASHNTVFTEAEDKIVAAMMSP